VGQLIALYNTGCWALGERLRVIHLVREDVFDQAISLHIASKTRQWASWLGQRATRPPTTPNAC
jgi:LPS sulfotransferase NodH